ncbi:MAG TPA: N-6 DNA methylase [Longimicrobium sp.]
MASNSDLVQQLWGLCNILRDDGITYHQYVNELSYLLFLKMAHETGADAELPRGFGWTDLAGRTGADQFDFYRKQLVTLGTDENPQIRAIFANPTSLLRQPSSLNILVAKIDEFDWYRARQEGLGDLYEGLLQKNASEKKSGAGQYFTPRPLIDCMVAVMKPSVDDVIQDPAAGTGGFLVAAQRYILENGRPETWTRDQRQKFEEGTFFGMEHVQDTHRLALMNLMLHGIQSRPDGAGIRLGDTLSPVGAALPRATLFLTNPPFGTKSGGGVPTRKDLPFPTSNKQFCFLQHIYLGLMPGGRAAVVLPDNVLFEGNIGKQIRVDLMNKCNLHTILRLPTGIFYAQGVNTNVLFFTRGSSEIANTQKVWVYDLRTGMPQYGKRKQLIRAAFNRFEEEFGDDPWGSSDALALRRESTDGGPFRCYSREEIAARNESLDLSWSRGNTRDVDIIDRDPVELAHEALEELECAMEHLRGILGALGEEDEQ